MKDDTKSKLDLLKASIPDGADDAGLGIYIGDPDPDSVGSGLGMAALFKMLFASSFRRVDIIYNGEISHEQNRTLVNVLNVKLLSLAEASAEEPLASKYSHWVFLDCVPREKWNKDIKPLLVIDHHKETCDAVVDDFRPNCGSCCSIVWEYLSEAGYDFESGDGAKTVSTALFFGIQNDTTNFTSDHCSDLDFLAYSRLAKFIDRARLSRILSYEIPEYFFSARRYLDVSENSERVGSCLIGFAGFLTEKQRNAMDMLADELVRMEGVDTSIVCGVVADNIQINVRSTNDALDVDGLCKKMFGKQYGGGKPGAGRVVVPMGFFSFGSGSDDFKQKGLAFVLAMLKHRIVQTLTGK